MLIMLSCLRFKSPASRLRNETHEPVNFSEILKLQENKVPGKKYVPVSLVERYSDKRIIKIK